MTLMIEVAQVPAWEAAGVNPPSEAGKSAIEPAYHLGSVRVPSLTDTDSRHLPPDTAQPDLMRYVRVLLARFAAHGQGQDPGRCLCGNPCPCAEEQQVARLLELAGDACQ
jgi:hypothetical protein